MSETNVLHLIEKYVSMSNFTKMHTTMFGLRSIDVVNPLYDDVVDSANKLEYLAIVWDNQYVDRSLITMMYRDVFIATFEEIQQVKPSVLSDITHKLYNAFKEME